MNKNEVYDVVVIGSGPAGYAAAIKSSKNGKKVACIEKEHYLGGTCLNSGCIPSKTLLDVSKKFKDLKLFEKIGINVGQSSINLPRVMAHKRKIVDDLAFGLSDLFERNNVTHIRGCAEIIEMQHDVSSKIMSTETEIHSNDSVDRINKGYETNEGAKTKDYGTENTKAKGDAIATDSMVKIRITSSENISENMSENMSENINDRFILARNLIIATGSHSADLPNCRVDEKNILSSKSVLNLESIPKKVVIVGAGYIGLELGSVLSRLGTEVIILDNGSIILPNMDLDVSSLINKKLTEQGIKFIKNASVHSCETLTEGGVKVKFDLLNTNKEAENTLIKKEGVEKKEINREEIDREEINREEIEGEENAEFVLVSVGRVSNTSGIGLENINCQFGSKNSIKVDENFRVISGLLNESYENIFAIGDAIGGDMLAHKAEEEAIFVADFISNKPTHINYDIIPSVMYVDPEIACVGMNENKLMELGIDYKMAKFPLKANLKANAIGIKDGFVKIMTNNEGKILGCCIVGHEAGLLIQEVAAIMSFNGTSDDLCRVPHSHPSISESVREAARMINGYQINI